MSSKMLALLSNQNSNNLRSFFWASSGIYPQFRLCETLGFLYTCSSWVSIPKTQFVGFSYPINFLSHSLSGATNYKILLSQQTLKKLWKISDFFCSVKLFVLDYLLWIHFFYGLNSTKSLRLFRFIWVRICGHIHLYPLSNYLLQTPQIYSDFMWSFPLSKSELLYSVSLMKHSLRDLF